MLALNEALRIFNTATDLYMKLCKENDGTILSNHKAFFLNFIPFTHYHGGSTGYQRASVFKRAIADAPFSHTEELIKFAINYPHKGGMFNIYLSEAIRQAAGFTKEHVDILAEEHSKNLLLPEKAVLYYLEHRHTYKSIICQQTAIKEIDDAIARSRSDILLKKLDAQLEHFKAKALDNDIELRVLPKNKL